MTLGQKQRLFSKLIGELIGWAYANGFELSFGDAYRDPRLHGYVGEKKGYGRASSNHKLRLAVDFNLFIGGIYQQSTSAHKPIGEHWEGMHYLCTWGGRFDDGNHYSFEHNGRR